MRIAIVNDSRMAVEVIRRVLVQVPEHQIAWAAYDGEEAVRKCAEDTPDLVLMDLHMPVMDGVEATRQIMENSPCAILVVTASVGKHAAKVFEAMGFGALDAVDTPIPEESGQSLDSDSLLGKIATIGKLVGRANRRQSDRGKPRDRKTDVLPLVVIGASTGGPMALAKVLQALPKSFAGGIVLIQHVDVQFSEGLATWLDTQVPIDVRLAYEGCRPEPGVAWVAGTNQHLVLTDELSLSYVSRGYDTPYHPSVDVFFKSVARHWPGQGAAALLTGMGHDGADGLLALRGARWTTFAQDEETSVVYGMPRAAARLGAAQEILPIEKIGAAIAGALAGTD